MSTPRIEETFAGDLLSGVEVLLISTHGVLDSTDILVQESESGIPVGDRFSRGGL